MWRGWQAAVSRPRVEGAGCGGWRRGWGGPSGRARLPSSAVAVGCRRRLWVGAAALGIRRLRLSSLTDDASDGRRSLLLAGPLSSSSPFSAVSRPLPSAASPLPPPLPPTQRGGLLDVPGLHQPSDFDALARSTIQRWLISAARQPQPRTSTTPTTTTQQLPAEQSLRHEPWRRVYMPSIELTRITHRRSTNTQQHHQQPPPPPRPLPSHLHREDGCALMPCVCCSVRRCEELVRLVEGAAACPSLSLLRGMDDISDALCRAVDVAELTRNVSLSAHRGHRRAQSRPSWPPLLPRPRSLPSPCHPPLSTSPDAVRSIQWRSGAKLRWRAVPRCMTTWRR